MIVSGYGDCYARISGCNSDQRIALSKALLATKQWEDVVPGISSVTVTYANDLTYTEAERILREAVRACDVTAPEMTNAVSLSVSYGGSDGPDLDRLAKQNGITEAALIKQHEACLFTVEMMGFTPGFAYLSGFENDWSIARLATPAKEIPAGSVGIVGTQCGIYGLKGPGGWPIIGRADAQFFDIARDDPFLLSAGMRVRFQSV